MRRRLASSLQCADSAVRNPFALHVLSTTETLKQQQSLWYYLTMNGFGLKAAEGERIHVARGKHHAWSLPSQR